MVHLDILTDIFAGVKFHPVISLPDRYEVFDFTEGYEASRILQSPFGIGRYNEERPSMYHYALFQSPSGETRNIHLGIDISAPVGTPVYAFANGQVFCASINSAPGDYGGTIITSHLIGDLHFWVLHGHLSHESVSRRKPGQAIGPGEVLAAIGDKQENGGWNPHLHFQISLQQPEKCDLPGTCSRRERAEALRIYPDPRLILGALY